MNTQHTPHTHTPACIHAHTLKLTRHTNTHTFTHKHIQLLNTHNTQLGCQIRSQQAHEKSHRLTKPMRKEMILAPSTSPFKHTLLQAHLTPKHAHHPNTYTVHMMRFSRIPSTNPCTSASVPLSSNVLT